MAQQGSDNPEQDLLANRPLRLGDFDRQIGVVIPARIEGETHMLTLVQSEELANSHREDGGFRLEFEGASQPILPQGIYRFEIEGNAHDIFITPLGPGVDGNIRYESVFF